MVEHLRGRCWCRGAIAFPAVCDQATLLRLLAIEHPTRVTRSCETVDSIDRCLDNTLWWRRKGAIREIKIQWRARNLVSSGIAIATHVLNDTMPDRGSAGDTNRFHHRGIISVAGPDTDHHIRSVADGPVIRKIISGTGLSSHFGMWNTTGSGWPSGSVV